MQPFIQPEAPYLKDGNLIILVGQGSDGDYKGGRLMARFESLDLGQIWIFKDYYEPSSEAIG